jgi:hypothetical protein
MTRGRGGFIGTNVVPAAAAFNSAASGLWTVREQEALKRAGTWPTLFVNPTSLLGLQLWLDASDASTLYNATTGGSLVAADGGVARWEDKSGNGNHATQSTAANRPARRSSVVNSRDAIDFDGSNDGLSVNALSSIFNGVNKPFTVIAVAKTDVTNSTQDILSAGNSSNDDENARCVWNNGSQKASIYRQPQDNNPGKSVSGGTSLGTTTRAVSFVFNASTGIVFVNGSSDSSATDLALGFSLPLNVVAVGFLPRLNSAVYFNGYICELTLYNSALSDTNRSVVESYLMSKWGIA